MKILQTSLALIALFALMLPCAHADDHHDHEVAVVEDIATNLTVRSVHPIASQPNEFLRLDLEFQ